MGSTVPEILAYTCTTDSLIFTYIRFLLLLCASVKTAIHERLENTKKITQEDLKRQFKTVIT